MTDKTDIVERPVNIDDVRAIIADGDRRGAGAKHPTTIPTRQLMEKMADEITRLRADKAGEKLWLWRDGKDKFLAFRSLFPTLPGGGDPAVLGQPCGYAMFHPMRLAEAQAVSRKAKAEGVEAGLPRAEGEAGP